MACTCGFSDSGEHYVSPDCVEHRGALGFGQVRHDTKHSNVSASQAAREAQDALRSKEAALAAQPKPHAVPFTPRDALVQLADDLVVNVSMVAALLEDVTTHRDGAVTKTEVRTSIYLVGKDRPLVADAPLREVLAALNPDTEAPRR